MQIYEKTDNLSHSDNEIPQNPDGSFWSALRKPSTILKAAILFSALFTWFLSGIPFYGDQTTLVSIPALYYYDNGFSGLLLPDALTTGHPPLYPAILALLWMLFGKSLLVSHLWAWICFLFMMVQLALFAKKQVSEHARSLFLLLILCFPVIWAQLAGMGADLLLCGLLFAGLRLLRDGHPLKAALFLAFMPLLSLRGIVWVLAAGIYALYHTEKTRKGIFRLFCMSIVAIAPVCVWFWLQWAGAGWWLIPPHGNWAEHRSLNSGMEWLSKLGEYGLRMIEFGMLLPLVLIKSRVITGFRKIFSNDITLLLVIAVISLSVFVLPFKNPVLMRYLLPVHLLMLLSMSDILAGYGPVKRRLLTGATALLMLAHHFFTYPQIQNSFFEYSWGDGSLAHLAVFPFREDMRRDVQARSIPPEAVGTSFPEYKKFRATDLEDTDFGYAAAHPDELMQYEWILYSNTMNMVSKTTELSIAASYDTVIAFHSYPVWYVLYQRKPGFGMPDQQRQTD